MEIFRSKLSLFLVISINAIFFAGCVHRDATSNSGQKGGLMQKYLERRRQEDTAALGANFEERELTHQEKNRKYLLYTPSSINLNNPAALVIGFHGGSTTNARFARTTLFHRLADEQGFLIAYPNSINANWNDGRGTANPDIDDVGFVAALIEEIKSLRNVDPRRIYATGISNGAFMVQRLACEKADVIAAFSAIAGSMGVALRKSCYPSKPVSMMIINSPEDKFVPYKGGDMKRGAGGDILPVPELVEFWKQRNACASVEEKRRPKSISTDKTKIVERRYKDCKNKSELVQFIIEGGGHTWPSGKDQPPILVGPTSQELNATTESWTFFKDRLLAQ